MFLLHLKGKKEVAGHLDGPTSRSIHIAHMEIF